MRIAAESRRPVSVRAIRFKVPPGRTTYDDHVHGPIQFDHDQIEDFIILRSDGLPTYQLSVVSDDIDMAITHVIRGDDHISNTPKQILLYLAFGAAVAGVCACAADSGDRQEAPEQASRRYVGDRVRADGISPRSDGELSGPARWSPGGDREVLSRDEMVALFDVDGSAAATPCSTPRSSTGSINNTSCGSRPTSSRCA